MNVLKYNPMQKSSHNRKNNMPKFMEVWLVDLPFDNSDHMKKRPGIVVGSSGGMHSVVMITSSNVFSQKDFKIIDPECAGLDHDSTIRPEKKYIVSASKFSHKLGELSEYDQA